jgi:hypothetical protein
MDPVFWLRGQLRAVEPENFFFSKSTLHKIVQSWNQLRTKLCKVEINYAQKESQLFSSLWNRCHQWHSDIELNQISPFSASYSRINTCFTSGKWIGVWNCCASRAKLIFFTQKSTLHSFARSSINQLCTKSCKVDFLKTLLLSQGLKLSNSKPGCRVSALLFFVKYVPPMAFWHQAESDKCLFSFLFQDSHLFHFWKANRGLKLSRKLCKVAFLYQKINFAQFCVKFKQSLPTKSCKVDFFVSLLENKSGFEIVTQVMQS